MPLPPTSPIVTCVNQKQPGGCGEYRCRRNGFGTNTQATRILTYDNEDALLGAEDAAASVCCAAQRVDTSESTHEMKIRRAWHKRMWGRLHTDRDGMAEGLTEMDGSDSVAKGLLRRSSDPDVAGCAAKSQTGQTISFLTREHTLRLYRSWQACKGAAAAYHEAVRHRVERIRSCTFRCHHRRHCSCWCTTGP